MISEQQQEQASLYALGLLDAAETDALEQDFAREPELRRLVRELREAAMLALVTDEVDAAPPPALRARVLDQIAREKTRSNLGVPVTSEGSGKILRPRFGWVPWAAAAALLGCCVVLGLECASMLRQLEAARQLAAVPAPMASGDVFSRVAFCELEPTPDAPVRPRAAVLWDAAEHKGVLKVDRFAAPANGKNYQLWAVEAARKEPVNAGVVHLDAEGNADVSFQPDTIPGDNKVVALAISLEEAGGSPTNKGPILFVGKL